MKRKHWMILGMALLLGLASLTSGVARSASAAVVSWWVMAGGGRDSATLAGNVTLNGTLGQPITGRSGTFDGRTSLGAGYWTSREAPAAMFKPWVYLPFVQH